MVHVLALVKRQLDEACDNGDEDEGTQDGAVHSVSLGGRV